MDARLKGVLIGVVGIFFWFMPFASWYTEFMDQHIKLYQAGYHIGGISYLLLISMFAYAVFSWFRIHELRIVSSGVALLVCLIFIFQAGSTVSWGLIGSFLVSLVGGILGFIDLRKDKLSQA
ncbi:MAG: hypothetical protein ACP5QM_06590 [Caldisericum sp.]|jgi:hypothetical protein|uniref:hypothetical protein n=1 Tax=Caldisericum sp. TaxID=2499687 RepID=UPI003D0C8E6B